HLTTFHRKTHGDFEVSGNFFEGGGAGEVDETKNLKKVFGWRKNLLSVRHGRSRGENFTGIGGGEKVLT
ncbi:MAG: hypothetical protein ACLS43_07700, partial [Evtepia gabavorous]